MNNLPGIIFTRTLTHPKWNQLITWAPTDWLISLANPKPLRTTTTSGADGKPDRRVDLEELFQTMLLDGMRDPLVLGIGVDSQTVRLETGNQRVHCLLNHQIKYAPVVGYINTTSITNIENGCHKGIPWPIDKKEATPHLHTFVSADAFLTMSPLIRSDQILL